MKKDESQRVSFIFLPQKRKKKKRMDKRKEKNKK